MDGSMMSQHATMMANFWQAQLQLIEQGELDFKNYQLPLARIKKVMKTDDDVKPMVSKISPDCAQFSLDDQCWGSDYFR